jgi:hypothetical protein
MILKMKKAKRWHDFKNKKGKDVGMILKMKKAKCWHDFKNKKGKDVGMILKMKKAKCWHDFKNKKDKDVGMILEKILILFRKKIQINIYEIKRIYNFRLFSIMLKQEQDHIEV